MPAGGELAALFARRAKVTDEENGDADAGAGGEGPKQEPPSASAALPSASAPSRPSFPPRSSLPAPSAAAAATPPRPSPPPAPAKEPVKAATPAREERAKFEGRDLEAGIPTPSFLASARKNLKKPGEKAAEGGGGGSAGYASDPDVKSAGKAAASPGGLVRGGSCCSDSEAAAKVANIKSNSISNSISNSNSNSNKRYGGTGAAVGPSALGGAKGGDRSSGTKTTIGGFGRSGSDSVASSHSGKPQSSPRNTTLDNSFGSVGSVDSGYKSELELALAKHKSHSEAIKTSASSTSSAKGGNDAASSSGYHSFASVGSDIHNLHSTSSTFSNDGDVGKGSPLAAAGRGGAGKSRKSKEGTVKAASTCSSVLPEDEAAAAAASAIIAGVANGRGRSDSESGSNPVSSKNEMLAARRSRMVASRGTASASSVLSNDSSKKDSNSAATGVSASASARGKKPSPSILRREKLLARVRASQITGNPNANKTKGGNLVMTGEGKNVSSINTKQMGGVGAPALSFDSSRTAIISPTRDEFEVLFGDDKVACYGSDSGGSLDSITNEMHSTLNTSMSSATIPTNNVHSKAKVNVTPVKSRGGDGGANSQQARIHNASTPKIRGNSHYRRDNYDEGELAVGPGEGDKGAQIRSVPSNTSGSSQGKLYSGMPSFQQQQQEQQQHQHQQDLKEEATQPEDSFPNNLNTPTRRHQGDIQQSYPFRQSPSQMSQMSGITTPSCFPQEFHMPSSGGMPHLQQPLLVGGPIYETYEMGSAGSSPRRGGPIGAGQPLAVIPSSSAFSSGIESENRRLREQVDEMKKKLEEKDAIISQLMKRIGDLETMNSDPSRLSRDRPLDDTSSHHSQQSHLSRNLVATPSSVSTSLHSARSGSQHVSTTSSRDPHGPPQPNPSYQSAFAQVRSSSVDTENANLSVPSSPPSHHKPLPTSASGSPRGRPARQGAHPPQQRGHSQGTASTASVTTANSSKSTTASASGRKQQQKAQHHPQRSKSVSDSARPKRSGGSRMKADDRKFVC
ncbi:hypothetical protein ACHAWF_009060 [Thalassiosira exigua]